MRTMVGGGAAQPAFEDWAARCGYASQLTGLAVMEPPAFHNRGACQPAEKAAGRQGEPDSDGLRELERRRFAI